MQTDGTVFDIHHPREIMVTNRYVAVGLDPVPRSLYFDSQAIVNMIHIIRIEELPEAATSTANV